MLRILIADLLDSRIRIPHEFSCRSQLVFTTGAGDAFVGGLLAYLSQETDWKKSEKIKEAVMWGNCCGSLAITKKGAMTALPSEKELCLILAQLKSEQS
jgi:fructokinase